MIHATPYIGFTGQAREALTFYRDVFGGTLEIVDMEGSPEQVMHGHLVAEAGWHLMAADNPESALAESQRVTICIWGDDLETMTDQFNRLAEDGTVHMPLEAQEWGDTFGGIKDKYGVDWGFNIGS